MWQSKPPTGIQLNRNHPLCAGLVSCWLFNEGSGLRVNDLSGNNHTGTLTSFEPMTSSRGWSGGNVGYSIIFDGLATFIDCGSIESTISGTMEAWVKSNTFGGLQYVMGGIDAVGAGEAERYPIFARNLFSCPAGDWGSIMADGISFQPVCSGQTYNSTNFPTNHFEHISVTYNGSVVNFYNDGVLINTVAQTVSGKGNLQPYSIGRIGAFVGLNYDGTISLVRIWNRALSSQEVNQLFSQPFAMFNTLSKQLRYNKM